MLWVVGQSVAATMYSVAQPRKQNTQVRGSEMVQILYIHVDCGPWPARDWPSSYSHSVMVKLSTRSSHAVQGCPCLLQPLTSPESFYKSVFSCWSSTQIVHLSSSSVSPSSYSSSVSLMLQQIVALTCAYNSAFTSISFIKLLSSKPLALRLYIGYWKMPF